MIRRKEFYFRRAEFYKRWLSKMPSKAMLPMSRKYIRSEIMAGKWRQDSYYDGWDEWPIYLVGSAKQLLGINKWRLK